MGSPFESNNSSISFFFSVSYALFQPTGVIISCLQVLSNLPLKEDVTLIEGWSSGRNTLEQSYTGFHRSLDHLDFIERPQN
jgi:hypothetical protein